MTNKLVVIINSLKVPNIKKILLYELEFLVPNYSCLQNPWLGGCRPQIPVLSVLNWIFWTPPHQTKFLVTPLRSTKRSLCLSSKLSTVTNSLGQSFLRSSASQENPRIFWTPIFNPAFTKARHLSLFWAKSIQSTAPHPTSWRSILILSSHISLGLPCGVSHSILSCLNVFTFCTCYKILIRLLCFVASFKLSFV